MNFVARVEESLRDLAQEARRKHPGVKEGSERAILTLRNSQAKYVSAVRKATSDPSSTHPTTALFRSQDVLRPFLLAANYPDASARILDIALGGIELLLEGDAVCEGDEKHILRVLGIQAGVCCDGLAKAELASAHGPMGMGAGVAGAASTAAAGVGAVIGGGWGGMFGGSGGGPGRGTEFSSAGDPETGSSVSAHSSQSTRNVRENEAAARRILRILAAIVEAPGLGLTEEVVAQCFTVCLVMLSCGCTSESKSVEETVHEIFGHARPRSVAPRAAQNDVGSAGGALNSIPSSSIDTSGKNAARRIRRAATGILKRIVLGLFQRASALLVPATSSEAKANDMGTGVSVHSLNPSIASQRSRATEMYSLARGTFLDLCALSSRSYRGGGRQATGPILAAITDGGASIGLRHGAVNPPRKDTCLMLLDAVLKEREDIFGASNATLLSPVFQHDGAGGFPLLLRVNAFPLAAETLLALCSDRLPMTRLQQAESMPDPIKSARRNDIIANAVASIPAGNDLSLLVASTSLARTMISRYSFTVDSKGRVRGIESGQEQKPAEIHTIITSLLRVIIAATECLRDTEGFEDGYIYDQLQNNLLSETLTGTMPSPPAVVLTPSKSGGQPPRPKKASRAQSVDSNQGLAPSAIGRPIPIPPTIFWGAALSLETLHSLLLTSLPVLADVLDNIAEVTSDYAAVGGSCAESIKGIVVAAARESSNEIYSTTELKEYYPVFFNRASELLRIFEDRNISDHKSNGKPDIVSIPALFLSEDLIGDSVWVAYKVIILLSQSLEALTSMERHVIPDPSHNVIESVFPPSLTAFQHFMKRLPGSSIIVSHTVAGYANLADAFFPCCAINTKNVQRSALLSSLCRLAIPSWGTNNITTLLEYHHIECLEALFGIIHRHYDAIMDDWNIILSTLQYLSSISMSSEASKTNVFQHKAALISSCLTRLSSFTTALSDDSLRSFVIALIDISVPRAAKPGARSGNESRPEIDGLASQEEFNATSDSNDKKESTGVTGRLLSFAFGSSKSDLKVAVRDSATSTSSTSHVTSSKTYAEDYSGTVYSRLAATKPGTRKDVFQSLPFSLIAMTDVVLSNYFRYSLCGPAVASRLQEIALASAVPEMRIYAVDSLTNIVTLKLSGTMSACQCQEEGKPHSVQVSANSLEDYLLVANDVSQPKLEYEEVSQADILGPLCETAQKCDKIDTAEASLNALYGIFEGYGHNLSGDAWLPLIRTIGALSGHKEGEMSDSADVPLIDRSLAVWSTCSMQSFRCLKLIVDDFLDELPSPPEQNGSETRSALLDCCAAFCSSDHDVNTSLTATGMLWTIADQDNSPEALDHVLERLASLSFDDRVEVRNCSINTLFSCVVGLGDDLSTEQWRVCLSETLFGVLNEISQRASQKVDASSGSKANVSETQSSRYKVTVHHSRDSSSKQWSTTQVLALRGLERVLRQYFCRLLMAAISTCSDLAVTGSREESDWFEKTWAEIISSALDCGTRAGGGRDDLDIRVVGVDLLILCGQLSSEAGIAAVTTQARVGTNMQVVNGALRSVTHKPTNTNTGPGQKCPKDDSESSNLDGTATTYRRRLFGMTFDSIESLCYALEDQAYLSDDNRSAFYAESTLLQVLTKVSAGLNQLYECCKEKEMAPPRLRGKTDHGNDVEIRMTKGIISLLKSSVSDPSSKYLTQAQRCALDLLRTMSLHGSFVALRELTKLGGSAYYRFTLDNRTGTTVTNDITFASQTLEFECAKVVVNLFLDGSVDRRAKLYAFETLLDGLALLRKQETPVDDLSYPVRYDMFLPILRQVLEIASISNDSYGDETDDRSDIWKKIVDMISMLVGASDDVDIRLLYNTKIQDIITIVNICLAKIPNDFNDDIGEALAKGAEIAVQLTKDMSSRGFKGLEDEERDTAKFRDDGLTLFKECFCGLYESQPNDSLLMSLCERLLKDAVDGASEATSMEEQSKDDAGILLRNEVDVDVALFICQAIRKLSNLEKIAITLFPWLCKLTRSESAPLRTEAGAVLSSVDMVAVVERAREAEERAAIAEARYAELFAKVTRMEEENEELRRQSLLGL